MENKIVWVIDRNDSWREMLAEFLQRDKASEKIGCNLTVRTFATQEEASAEFDKLPQAELPDVITTNVLSEKNEETGIDFLGKLKGPIGAVVVSADLRTQAIFEQLEKQGAKCPKFISKITFELDDFYAAVKSAIEDARLTSQPTPVVEKAKGMGGLPNKAEQDHGASIA